MPTIQRLGNLRIVIYYRDHASPHFHIVGPGVELVVEIETLVVRAGSARMSDVAPALAWAERNQALLRQRWQELHG